MKFLLFLLGVSFFFIFFLFSQNTEIKGSFFPNLYFEAHVYILFSLLCISFLFLSPLKKEKKLPHTFFSTLSLSRKDIFTSLKIFFERYVYYIAVSLFYSSLFLLFQLFLWEIDIPRIFLFFNILVVILYFLEDKFVVFQDFLRVNTAIISLYYIIFHILYLWGYSLTFSIIDGVNIVLLALVFYLIFVSQRGKNYKEAFQSYTISFLFLEYCVVMKYIFQDFFLPLTFGSFLAAISFLVFTNIFQQYLHISLRLLRIWGLIFSYLFLSSCFKELFWESNIHLLLAFWSGIIGSILYFFHKSFQNYISLAWSTVASGLSFFFFYQVLLSEATEKAYIYLFFFFLSWVFLIFDSISQKKQNYDTYFFHIISLIVNLFWVLSFFFLKDISILSIALLLAGESVYSFFSYYSLHTQSRIWYRTEQKSKKHVSKI